MLWHARAVWESTAGSKSADRLGLKVRTVRARPADQPREPASGATRPRCVVGYHVGESRLEGGVAAQQGDLESDRGSTT